jgi:exosortase H (IPTLxxWG-CTERM-specific)
MSRRRSKKNNKGNQNRGGIATSSADSGSKPTQRGKRKPSWIYAKKPVLGFVVLFGVLMGVFYGITSLRVVDTSIIPAYMRVNATASAAIINIFGEGSVARGTSVSSSRFSVNIQHGCDAVAPTMLFVAAVLAFPAPLMAKFPGAVVGTIILALINLVRIIALFFTGIYFPKAFEVMHVDVWQPVFILLALTLWIAWAWWATRDRVQPANVSAEAP